MITTCYSVLNKYIKTNVLRILPGTLRQKRLSLSGFCLPWPRTSKLAHQTGQLHHIMPEVLHCKYTNAQHAAPFWQSHFHCWLHCDTGRIAAAYLWARCSTFGRVCASRAGELAVVPWTLWNTLELENLEQKIWFSWNGWSARYQLHCMF